MVEYPNDGRGRVSDGRWVVKEEDVVVEVAVAIWWKIIVYRLGGKAFPRKHADS